MGTEASDRERQRRHWMVYGYIAAVVGPVAVTLVTLIPSGDLDRAITALLLVVAVLSAALVGGRGPAWLAAAISAVGFDLLHIAPEGRPSIVSTEELEVTVTFVVIAFLIGEMAVAAIRARENVLRSEFREARIGRVLTASSSGLDRDALVNIIATELVDELGVEAAEYEPDARSTCHYRIDRDGQLYHHADLLEGRRRVLPAQPVSVPVRAGARDFGQLVLRATGERRVSQQQLVMAARMAALLAALIHEVGPGTS